jgi:hypothetical protein
MFLAQFRKRSGDIVRGLGRVEKLAGRMATNCQDGQNRRKLLCVSLVPVWLAVLFVLFSLRRAALLARIARCVHQRMVVAGKIAAGEAAMDASPGL